MKRSKKKAQHITATLGKTLPATVRREILFASHRRPLNKIPAYMRLIAKRGAAVTNSRQRKAA